MPEEKSSAFRRPADANSVLLAKTRDTAIKNQNLDEINSIDYEAESHFTPRWLCPCGRDNECAVSTCNQCSNTRPPILHGDPNQGDPYLGLARMVARNILHHGIPVEYQVKSTQWQSFPSRYTIDQYKFDSEQKGKGRWMGWQDYVDFIQNGGKV